MTSPTLTGRTRLSPEQASNLLKCYAERCEAKGAAKRTDCSLNSVYLFYRRIRERLTATGYYRDGALSFDEPGLAPIISERLRLRRGIREEDIQPHAAELIEWAEQWPPRLVLKHLRKIIELTGPLDQERQLSGPQLDKLNAYVRYARTELIHDRRQNSPETGEAQRHRIDRAKAALDNEWRAYRAASKRVEREQR